MQLVMFVSKHIGDILIKIDDTLTKTELVFIETISFKTLLALTCTDTKVNTLEFIH